MFCYLVILNQSLGFIPKNGLYLSDLSYKQAKDDMTL